MLINKFSNCNNIKYCTRKTICIFIIIISTCKMGRLVHLKKLASPSSKDALIVQSLVVWLKLVQCFWRNRFLIFINVFSLFCYYMAFPLNNINLRFHLPQDALCQVWLKLAQWFWRRRFFNFINVFSLFRNYLPLEKSGALHLNKLESPSPKDALYKVWLKLAQWFWRRR